MKRKEKVTIKDIAKELGITPSSVSRALNGGSKISDKTREAVIRLADEWGYRPNLIAQNLQKSRSGTIGVVIPEFNHNFFSMMLHGIEDKAKEMGYRLLIESTGRSYEVEKQACFKMAAAKVDGLLIALSQDMEDYAYLNDITDDGIPIVLLDRICEDLDVPAVITDDFAGAFEAVHYLLEGGHEQVLHLKGEEGISTTFNRYMGYVEAHKKHSLEINSALIIPYSEKEQIQEMIIHRLSQVTRPTAIFACSDYLAFIAMETVKSIGLQIPEDVSIIGYADEPITVYTSPKLTTVKQPSYEMGQKAVTLLFDPIAKANSQLVKLGTSLILRDSTQPIVS
ncbi:LacI family DNA-binding transcriptional regulator [Limibacter armeniacum]|uniref:LacI family DNA-binding transcriptional regulator n=1 Tax=Limibacter armeniacum TaxID=466084 RepID=UPI002FE5AAEA